MGTGVTDFVFTRARVNRDWGQWVFQEFLFVAIQRKKMAKEVCFCFVLMRSTKPGCFRSRSWFLWKALEEEGAWAWFHGVWTCRVEVFEY
jgi:hypothetical protein